MIHKYRAWSTITRQMYDVVKIDYTHNMVELIDKSDGHVTWAYITSSEHIFMELVDFTDRNGDEIFEGDIVKMHYFFEDRSSGAAREAEEEIIGAVGIDVLGTYTECEGYKYYWLNYLELPEEELEVIGNIYENPELVEG